jgi:hypothetical protein
MWNASSVKRAVSRTGLVGAAGEYHVAAQLSQRGWLSTITIKNSPGTDVLAQHVDDGTLVAIQTKTTTVSDSWVLGVKDERPSPRTDSWYVLVALRAVTERPDFYVIPRNHVSAYLYVAHREWLRSPGRSGKPRLDNPMRNMYPAELQAYKEDWAALTSATSARPYALPEWFIACVGEIGLPAGHPDAAMFGAAAASSS